MGVDSQWEPRDETAARLLAHAARMPTVAWPVFAPPGREDGVISHVYDTSRSRTISDDVVETVSETVHVRLSFGTRSASETVVDVISERLDRASILSLDYLLAAQYVADRFGEYPVPGKLPAPRTGRLPEAPRAHPATVALDGRWVAAAEQITGPYRITRVVVPSPAPTKPVVVTVLERYGAGLVELAAVPDLTPYVARRVEHVRELLAVARTRVPTPPMTGPDQAQPLWAHRLLARHSWDGMRRARRWVELRRPDVMAGSAVPGLREAAVRQQMHLRGQDKRSAARELSEMSSQLQDLSTLSWWDDMDLQAAAIEEVIWVTATGEQQVSSAGAQGFWRRSRPDAHPAIGEDDPRGGWKEAWNRWAHQQPPNG